MGTVLVTWPFLLPTNALSSSSLSATGPLGALPILRRGVLAPYGVIDVA